MGGTIELIGMGLGAMGSTDFTKLLFLLSIAQRLEWRGQTQKDGGSNPSKVEFLNLIAENKPGQHSVDRPPSLLVANRYGPTIVRTNVQTLKKETLTNLRMSGAQSSWSHSGSLSSVLSSSLYMVTLRLSQVTSTIEMCSGWVWMGIRSTDLTTLLSLR